MFQNKYIIFRNKCQVCICEKTTNKLLKGYEKTIKKIERLIV